MRRCAGAPRQLTDQHDSYPLADVRAEFARLSDLVAGGRPTEQLQACADSELDAALESSTGTVAMLKIALRAPVEPMLDAVARAGLSPRYVGLGELTPPPGGGSQIEPVVRASAETADGAPLPVLVHGIAPNTAADLRDYATVAARYPHVPIVIGAFGGLNSMLAVELAVAHRNLHLDLSSALQVFVLAAALREVPRQCLFGSNTPYGDVLAARATVEAATADPGVRTLAFHDNAAELFGSGDA